MVSVETKWKWVALAAVAPITWGSVYYVILHFLPPGEPFIAAALRALPAGLLLLLIVRRLPKGVWWWRSLVLGVLNVGAFFILIYVAAKLLPTSVATLLMSIQPLVMMFIAWGVLSEKPTVRRLLGAVLGVVGVAIMLGGATGALDGWGVAASLTALVLYAYGSVLTKQWSRDVDPITLSAWQLTVGGVLLLVPGLLIDGLPTVDSPLAVFGYAYVTLIPTALAFIAWFTALAHLTAGQVALVGLLNPVTGVVMGVVLAGERFTLWQLVGIATILVGIVIGQLVVRRRRGVPQAAGKDAEGVHAVDAGLDSVDEEHTPHDVETAAGVSPTASER